MAIVGGCRRGVHISTFLGGRAADSPSSRSAELEQANDELACAFRRTGPVSVPTTIDVAEVGRGATAHLPVVDGGVQCR
jgi:hypothetical protein